MARFSACPAVSPGRNGHRGECLCQLRRLCKGLPNGYHQQSEGGKYKIQPAECLVLPQLYRGLQVQRHSVPLNQPIFLLTGQRDWRSHSGFNEPPAKDRQFPCSNTAYLHHLKTGPISMDFHPIGTEPVFSRKIQVSAAMDWKLSGGVLVSEPELADVFFQPFDVGNEILDVVLVLEFFVRIVIAIW
jgi:hypothetical protein